MEGVLAVRMQVMDLKLYYLEFFTRTYPVWGLLVIIALVLNNSPLKIDTIEIDAPMLRLFDFTGNISSIRLKNVLFWFTKEAEDDDCILECLELEHFSDVTFNHLRG
ncbi:hypothetical protein HAX54_017615 [Datura stramonium]|uniref:Uncharacterized protein n=1 Tax=Datura stramonium TaxID=4076 RepID=A0ABS8UN84_DATST|nr:hypothetical protein [Datura stramonium]